jgi:hypothetical protein
MLFNQILSFCSPPYEYVRHLLIYERSEWERSPAFFTIAKVCAATGIISIANDQKTWMAQFRPLKNWWNIRSNMKSVLDTLPEQKKCYFLKIFLGLFLTILLLTCHRAVHNLFPLCTVHCNRTAAFFSVWPLPMKRCFTVFSFVVRYSKSYSPNGNPAVSCHLLCPNGRIDYPLRLYSVIPFPFPGFPRIPPALLAGS